MHLEELDLVRNAGTRADEREVAADHVEKLWKLVEAPPAEPAAHVGDLFELIELVETVASGLAEEFVVARMYSRWTSCVVPMRIVRNLRFVNSRIDSPSLIWR